MASISGLDSYFTNIIDSLMTLERRPLELLEDQRDSLSIQSGVFQDLQTKLSSLQDKSQQLISSDPFYSLTPGRSGEILRTDPDEAVFSAAVSSDAGVGSYEVTITQLAEVQRQASAVQSSIDQALGLSGTFWLGGSGTASSSVTPNGTVTGSSTAAVSSGQLELGTMDYTIETRDNNGTLEFRIKDIDGSVVSIADHDGPEGSTTTSWQTVETGDYDTGRGLVVSLDENGSAGSTTVSYTAAGVDISIESADSLLDIASKINNADQPEGRSASATIVGTQLVLSADQSGTNHTMIYTDSAGLGFSGLDLQSAEDAVFSVNDIEFTRSGNSIDDVINGVILELAADGEGKTATLEVSSDLSGAKTVINDFISEFNGIISYIEAKTAITKISTSEFSRGPLADDSIFSNLRSDLLQDMMNGISNGGQFSFLREIGISVNDSLQLTVSDEELLAEKLEEDFSDVTQLFDSVLAGVDSRLERFTGSTNYLSSAINNLGTQLGELDEDISSYEDKLDQKEIYLENQYAEIQSQLALLQYTQQIMSSINSTINMYG